jgi:hypothetical protein
MADEADIVRKVQALWAKADDPAATPAEKEAFTEKARELMAKHAIDEMVLAQASSVEESIILADILVHTESGDMSQQNTLVPEQRIRLANVIYTHHRCYGILRWLPASVKADGSPQAAGRYLTVVGHKSDVQMVRLMFNGLLQDMIIAMSFEPVTHMTKPEQKNFYENFCDGYAERINVRLYEVEARIEQMANEGSLLPVLRDRKAQVMDKVDAMWPDRKVERAKQVKYNGAARERGIAAADKANIGAGKKGVGGERKGLPQ